MAAAIAAAAGLGFPAGSAIAADPPAVTNVNVVGTSDVSDSFLVQTVIKPGFQAAYPQYNLVYTGKGTGAAITLAEQGTADAMIVHAASLENQFVGSGYSLEPYGRAVFWGDYVLLGPASDPAGVLTNAPHDIATAFEDIAAAGDAGTANFVSRGGTPGTTIQEHAIWALTNGVQGCKVSATNGGGIAPSTKSGACPTTPVYPSWYHATGDSQGTNVLDADGCAPAQYTGGGCYVFTDRGTYDYLVSQNEIHTLTTVVRNNDPSARGTNTALVNSFHAYAINPSANFGAGVHPTLNTVGATDLLNWMTSPAAQTAIGNYLNDSSDAPFLPSASPTLTVTSTLPTSLVAGKPITVTGHLDNVVPGTPALSNEVVTLNAAPADVANGTAVPVASASTNSTGDYSITYNPTADEIYTVSTGPITKIEVPTLTPTFGDELAPSTTSVGTLDVTKSTSTITKVTVAKTGKIYQATVTVAISPSPTSSGSVVHLIGKYTGTKLNALTHVSAKTGATTVTLHYQLGYLKHTWKTRTWTLEAVYTGTGIQDATSAPVTVKLPLS